MNAREWMNNNSAVVTIVAVVVLVVALGVIFWNAGGGNSRQGPIDVYYFDLGSGKLFVGKSDEIAPIKAPSGAYGKQQLPGGVLAHVYACGKCPGDLSGATVGQIRKEGGHIAYLQMTTPKAKQAMEKLRNGNGKGQMPPELMDPSQSMRIRGVNSKNWVTMYSKQGMQLQQNNECSNQEQYNPCLP